MSKRRILIFSTAYAPFVGGAEIAVREITDRLSNEFDFVLVTARINQALSAREKIGVVEVIRVGNGTWFDKINLWWNGWKVAEENGQFDVVWGIMASYGGLAALRYKTLRLRSLRGDSVDPVQEKIPFLLTLQEGDSLSRIYSRAFFIWPWFKQIFRKADRIQAISNYLAVWAKKMGATCLVDVVPNGVALADEKIFLPVKKFNSGKKLILSVSRLVEKNGLEYLIRAMIDLPESYILEIVGEGKLRPRLEKMIKDLELSERVILRGEVPYQEVGDYYARADVFVRPSLSEGLGNVFLEAMQKNVPVIATPVGGIVDFLEEGKTGWFCQARDSRDIAKKIEYVLAEKNAEEVEQVKARAKQMISEKFTWEIV